MHWLFLLLALGALILAFSTPHMWLLVLSLFAALAFMAAWARGWYVSRVGEAEESGHIVDPVELHRLRSLAAARKAAAAEPPASEP
ncbi:hypothetical protein ARC20_02225 [Stenotrophomonas panacihumi]|uniref:Uncharacterized protein n=1 Tax=Stenotrophomonas panacihumi TaxID=676599 RepID=A0A0R0A5D5_9GAMM|nr:hypothetical protein [Stenotrophomonas panacihumi]KRG37730.1 hypothetical protein ARC20_02225 [Stenotrophomonas panacihumi]PTN56095.1 hypothetical protein C9J98_02140 [Stenotrophomonas panacihumi]